jgi:hypothetical protein
MDGDLVTADCGEEEGGGGGAAIIAMMIGGWFGVGNDGS